MKGINKATFFIVAALIVFLGFAAFNGVHFTIGDKAIDIKGANETRFGIDIRGGVEALFFPRDYEGVPTEDELASARSVIENRLDSKNITDRDVTVNKENGSILVRFPWKSDETEFDPQKALAEIGETALLTFRDSTGNVLIRGERVTHAKAEYYGSNGGYVVSLAFDDEGAKQFEDATASLIGQRMGIYMDDVLISNPNVDEKISGGNAMITGMANIEEARVLAEKINAGALPFSLQSTNYSTISPSMGMGALDVMVRAGMIAFILVCLFMLIFYRLPGFVAVFALSLQVAGQLLAVSVPQFTLTLPGIAAIILSIGMGVDANIITSERIREEINVGKTVGGAIESGFHKAFSSVFDGNITVMIVAIILMVFGSGTMLSFGYSLLTGVILNFLCGVLTSKVMIKSLSLFEGLKKPWLYARKLKERKVIRFYQNRFKYYAVSLLLLAVGVGSIFINGIDYDIRFQGGAIIKYEYIGEIDTERIEDITVNTLERNCEVQLTRDIESDTTKFVLNLAGKEGLSASAQNALDTALREEFASNNIKQAESSVVEPFIGKKFAFDSVKAIILSAICIILYVWFSFRKISGMSAGVSGLLALLHDVLIVFFVFTIFKMPVNDSFIAAALTILGFSINDTIVIYDRVRENKGLYGKKMPIEDIVNKSITQSLSRSINTSLCTLLSIAVVFVFASQRDMESIQTLALPLIFGIISGCYSTICIAGPLWVAWQKHKEKRAARRVGRAVTE